MPLRGFRQVKRCTVKNASRMFISALSHISASITAMPSPMRARTLASINTFLTLFFCTAVPAYAEIYRCTSHEGKMISADRVPAECRGKLIRVFSDSGSFKSEIMPPLSAAEKQKKAQEVESQQQQKMVAEEFLREERFLTAHFRSESDITQAQKKALELVEAKKKMVLEQLDLLANIVYELRIEISNAKQLDKNSKSFQQLYQSRLDELTRSIKKSQDQLATYEIEIDRINREYDQTLQRYRVVVVSRRR